MHMLWSRPWHGPALVASALCAGWAHPPTAWADTEFCGPATDPVVLQLRWVGSGGQAQCDLKALARLPARDLPTTLPDSLGMPGVQRWRGVPLRYLVEQMGGSPAQTVQLTALNDYTVSVPWSDLVQFDPIVAYQRNGLPMSVRDKGPLMLIYPFGSHPALESQHYLNRSIWQINAITLK